MSGCDWLKSCAVIAHRSNILLLCKHSERLPRRHQDSTRPRFRALLHLQPHEESCLYVTVRPLQHRTHFSIWQEGARRRHLATVHMGTKSPRRSTELKHLRVFFISSECPTRRGVDGPAASPRHQLEGQGRARESLHCNHSFTQWHTCN